MDTYSLVVGFSLAIGVGMIANTVLSIIIETGRRLSRSVSRGRLQALGLGIRDHNGIHNAQEGSHTEETILGLSQVPWNSLYAGAALVGLILLATLGPSLPSIRFGFLTLPAFVWLAKRYLIQQRKRFMVGQIRQFLIDVRLHMSLQGSLLLGLESISKTTLETSAVYQSLKRRLAGSSARSGLELLNQIAEDLQSPLFTRLVQRIQAAQQSGGVSDIDQAIAGAIEELNEEIGYQSEEQMQRLPLRITLLAMPFLLGPIVILLFYPLVDRILKTLSGVAVGSGF
ncbi:hypothetical protein [Leptolinea tardivitalis]|uniref:Uncharacterized protein n=1 Tax=Leptolinea tardivitalis TaxID=229920 RepID=A0A0P6WNE5_9CHLR|nr:hypothetical protein [Leptolinea tardivitalis]KPL70341.1 hypothetical protein ADM99_14375 [Leptolinea tardivitalis]GAP21906.1 hypothetical protein LTAR_02124 [Leptolinea tardivitalis]